MSLVFNDTTNKSGIIQQIERNCGFNDGEISGNTVRMAQFTSDINVALDQVFAMIFEVGGTWQFDDSNHTDYPIITRSLVSGQRDYPFTTDEQNNLILDIYKVFVSDEHGVYTEVCPRDVQSNGASTNYTDGLNTGGIPNTYDKTANGFFLDPIPNYNYTNGLKVYINREGSYFTTADTTKKAGFAGLFHEYLALRPSYFYCMRNNMDRQVSLKNEMLEMEQKIMTYYKSRERDVVKTMRARRNRAR